MRFLERRVEKMETQMRVNTEMIHAIKSDTEEVITILKGSKIGGRVLLWLAMLWGALMSIWTSVHAWLQHTS